MQLHCESTLKRQRVTPVFLPGRTVKIKAENVTLKKKELGISIIWQERSESICSHFRKKNWSFKHIKICRLGEYNT